MRNWRQEVWEYGRAGGKLGGLGIWPPVGQDDIRERCLFYGMEAGED